MPLRRWVRRGLVLLALALVLGGSYLGTGIVLSHRTLVLPEPPGGGPVGRRTSEWTDRTRLDSTAPHPGRDRRSLSVWTWYPAARTPGRSAPYAPGLWSGLHWPGPIGWGETSFDAIRTHSVANATPDRSAHHLVVLAPGLGLSVVQYQSVAEALASHGLVVVGFTPTHSANLTVLRGSVVGATPAGRLPDASLHRRDVQAAALRLLRTWAADARFVAARARVANRDLRILKGVIYVGHSFGGATSLEACREDSTCLGAADLDGLEFGEVSAAGLKVPMLLLGHDNSCVTGECRPDGPEDRQDLATARAMIRAGRAAVYSVDVTGTRHFDFTDYAAYRFLFPLRRLLPLGGRSGRESLLISEKCLLDFTSRISHARPTWGCLDGKLGGVVQTTS